MAILGAIGASALRIGGKLIGKAKQLIGRRRNKRALKAAAADSKAAAALQKLQDAAAAANISAGNTLDPQGLPDAQGADIVSQAGNALRGAVNGQAAPAKGGSNSTPLILGGIGLLIAILLGRKR